ncbi:unnamed protein product [Ambrosiozyma monospora]|uniref:Unnamed protein product n=1 Tax=Ambrosiozyma monospora TaxID=43982 RepID=A0A9W6Z5C1_AMBMO|nr:unnamed protein product [Ambrosiozyma monospora]
MPARSSSHSFHSSHSSRSLSTHHQHTDIDTAHPQHHPLTQAHSEGDVGTGLVQRQSFFQNFQIQLCTVRHDQRYGGGSAGGSGGGSGGGAGGGAGATTT